MSNVNRAVHGPGWGEVILGACLSLVLGAIIGAAILVTRPVIVARELPKEEDRKAGAVYYLEGSKGAASARQAAAKQRAFVEGQSVTVTEDELNALLSANAAVAQAAAKADAQNAAAKDKKANPAGAAPDSGEMLAVGTPNVRIRDGVLQVAAPVTLNAVGLSHKLIVQARGGFAKEGDVFTYEPSALYVGSCPVERLPLISGYLRNKILNAQPIPEDVAAAWRRLSNVAIEGNALRLSMP